MEELIEQFKRIADAMEAGNTLTQQWLEWQKQQKMEEREQLEHWQEDGIEKIITARKEQDELMLALQRELLTGEKEKME